MTIIKTMLKGALALLSVVGLGTAAQAQTCGITTLSSSTQTVNYDPFSPAGLATTAVTLTIQRINPGGGGDTRLVNLYLRSNSAAANGTVITTQGGGVVSAGAGLNIFHNSGGPFPVISPVQTATPSAGNRFIRLDFTGNNPGSDTAIVTFNVTLPANLNLQSSGDLAFDVDYTCFFRGGQNNNTEAPLATRTNAIVFPVRVLSALQASYVGNATGLDFGEVGDVTTAQVLGAPATYTTPITNYVRVASSGPYSVTLVSQNGYRLTFPGGNLANPDQRLDYRVLFLGQTRSNASPTFATVNCVRAGIDASAGTLPIRATLLEGGLGTGTPKAPAPNYNDFLTVTITPLVVAGAQQSCSTL